MSVTKYKTSNKEAVVLSAVNMARKDKANCVICKLGCGDYDISYPSKVIKYELLVEYGKKEIKVKSFDNKIVDVYPTIIAESKKESKSSTDKTASKPEDNSGK